MQRERKKNSLQLQCEPGVWASPLYLFTSLIKKKTGKHALQKSQSAGRFFNM
jgi:hypothetical protein